LTERPAPFLGGRTLAPLPPRALSGFVLAFVAVLLIGFFTYRLLDARYAAAGRITIPSGINPRPSAMMRDPGFSASGNEAA